MIDKMMDAGIFGGIAALFGVAFSFGVLKIFKVKSPLNHKLFYVFLALGMVLAYLLKFTLMAYAKNI